MNQEIELQGYKARLTGILSRTALPPWNPTDELLVIVEFNEHPEGIIETTISIPAKDYSPEEFLRVVNECGQKQICDMLERHRKEKKNRKHQEQRKLDLDTLAERIASRWG